MKIKDLNKFLKDMSYGSTYKILDEGSDKEELLEVAKKANIVLPSPDLAIFKCNYAFVDTKNKNGCILPKEEVEKSLSTLVGKAIDFDHLRKKIVGHFIDAKLEGDAIIAYGIFFKSNLKEDYELITELMDEGNLKVSFEAYGERDFLDQASYELNDIHWAGGALLIDTKPAFGDRTEVLELSNKNKNRVLELAKVMVEPKSFIRSSEEKQNKVIELARFYIQDFETVLRLVQEVGNPNNQNDFGYHDILAIDFLIGKVRTKWVSFDTEDNSTFFNIYISPRAEEGKESNIKLIKFEEEKASSSQDDLKKVKSTDVEGSKKMDEKIEKLQGENATLKVEKDNLAKEIASLKESIATLQKSYDEAKAKVTEAEARVTEKANELAESLTKAETDKAEAIKVAVENAKISTERRSELGEFAKEMSDEDLLNNDKFEIAKLKKENSELKTKSASTSVNKGSTDKLDVGSKTTESEFTKTQKRIRQYAFGKESESK